MLKISMKSELSMCITKREYVLLLDRANGGWQEICYIRNPIYIYAWEYMYMC
jgi:hypothetical protein